jgi:hypothetical protein
LGETGHEERRRRRKEGGWFSSVFKTWRLDLGYHGLEEEVQKGWKEW